jgi:hypothetical protein
MKKITLLLALVCSMSMFATRYLVQLGTGGAATWRAAEAGETLVDLTVAGQSFNAWHNALTATAGEEVWVIKGTYVTTGVTTIKTGLSLYGGFIGTENSLSDRAKVSGGKPWEFVNVTTLDGNNTNKGFSSGNLANDTYIDGFTITKCKATVGAGAEIGTKTTIKNCIIKDSEATSTTNDGGGGVRVKGGSLLNSHILNNVSTIGGAGGVGIQSTSLVRGCLVERNRVLDATKGGGGINLATSGGATIDSCIIKNNTAPTGAGINSYLASASAAINISNTQIIDNTASANGGGMFLNISSTTINFTNCEFKGNKVTAGNGGGMRINLASATFNKCLIADNSCTASGGAVYNQSTSPLNIYNSLIINNSSPNNAILLQNNNAKNIYNTTIASNTGNVFYYATADMTNSSLKNVLIYNNEKKITIATSTAYPSITYTAFDSDESGQPFYGTGCINTINSSNTFVNPTAIKGAHTNVSDSLAIVNSNWELLYNAPALNAGQTLTETSTDFLSVARPQGASYDIGAYELTYYNTTVTFNAGGTVNALTSGDILSEPKGKPLAFTITPSGGQMIASVKYNDVEVKGDIEGNVYTAPALAANATLVVEFSPTTSLNGIKNIFVCFAAGNTVELQGVTIGHEVSVYSVTGTRLFNVRAVNTEISVPVSRGIYIVKVADSVRKIVID